MSTDNRAEREPDDLADADVQTIEDHIQQTRADLGETVDQLADKLDVKKQAKERASAAGQRAKEQLDEARRRLSDGQGHLEPGVSVGAAAAVAVAVSLVTWLVLRRRSR